MKTTDSKDLVKVNQILPIMQEYFGKSMNLARIKFMAYMLHALCVMQTVSLHKPASAMPTSVERDSNLRRIQRFIANYALNLDLVARMIFSLLPVKPSTGERIRTWWLFNSLKVGQEKFYYKLFLHKGQYVYLAGSRIKNSEGIPELQILICFNRPEDGVATYKKRWEIETAFRAMKSSGSTSRTPICETESVSHVCLRWPAWLLYGRISLVNIKILFVFNQLNACFSYLYKTKFRFPNNVFLRLIQELPFVHLLKLLWFSHL